MKHRVDNAIIMAAGTSSRFAPLSYEHPKALISVKGEILIERQIRQLQEAGIHDITIVVGHKKEQFDYLREVFGVRLAENPDYLTRNNHSSIYAVRHLLKNTYICSGDNYFTRNPFEAEVDDAYYAALFANGPTKEWCMQEDSSGYIASVEIGGENAWYMLGHTFWTEKFSRRFVDILTEEYDRPETKDLFWENIFIKHLDELKMRIRPYDDDFIFEFDSLEELRLFDPEYIHNTRSSILRQLSVQLGGKEHEITVTHTLKDGTSEASGFGFRFRGKCYEYQYESKEMRSTT